MPGEFFDPKGEWLIYEHCRPHWSQAGAVVFITFAGGQIRFSVLRGLRFAYPSTQNR
jgi:hypothetical protein